MRQPESLEFEFRKRNDSYAANDDGAMYVVDAPWGQFEGESWHEAYWAAMKARPRR
jgi:hypothetical protein